MLLSENMENLICEVVQTNAFWRMNYYLKSMKKAPHGGVFHIHSPNFFLKLAPADIFRFYTSNAKIPMSILKEVDNFSEIIHSFNASNEELLQYCFRGKSDSSFFGNRMSIAFSGKIITSNKQTELERLVDISDAIEGKSKFLENFEIDEKALILFFIFTLIENGSYGILDLGEIVSHERLATHADKYGLIDVSRANFYRQGFIFNSKYYLYNIFFDTSIGNPSANIPEIIEIIQKIDSNIQISMRCDENLATSDTEIVNTATLDFEKWRGITLNFQDITNQLLTGNETIVHYDPETMHKILVYVKRGTDEKGIEFYHVSIEQLWNPEIFKEDDNVVITNFIHGTYYPTLKTFEHIDFSLNQYGMKKFLKKYNDEAPTTGVSINQYGEQHYKIWCIRSDKLNSEVWANLVHASLDIPFREIFSETIEGNNVTTKN